MTLGDTLLGLLASVVAGSLLAAAAAIAFSPLAPIGLVRPVDPSLGIAIDWAVLGSGVLVLIGGLSAVAMALAYRQHRSELACGKDEPESGDRP